VAGEPQVKVGQRVPILTKQRAPTFAFMKATDFAEVFVELVGVLVPQTTGDSLIIPNSRSITQAERIFECTANQFGGGSFTNANPDAFKVKKLRTLTNISDTEMLDIISNPHFGFNITSGNAFNATGWHDNTEITLKSGRAEFHLLTDDDNS